MKNCLEIEEMLRKMIGDEVVGFFERKFSATDQEVRVFIPVYKNTKLKSFVN